MILDSICTFMPMFRIKVLVLALFSALSLHAQDCSKIHLVLKGETLYGIARSNGCTVDQLLSANPGIGLPLQEAASVCIPRIQTPRPDVEESKSSQFHTVVLGESIYGISKKYACSIDTLYLLNPTLLETGLFSGQKIRVPIKRQEETAVPEKTKMERPATPSSNKINIALFAPFDESKPEYFEVALSFMEGVQLAMSDWSDSLTGGLSLTVYNEFEPFNGFEGGKPTLVFGPFLTQNYARISPKITQQNIPIFSPFSKQWEPKSKTEFKVNHSEVEAWTTYISGFHNQNPNSSIFLSKASIGKDSLLRSQVVSELRKKGIPFSTCEASGSGISAQTAGGRESLFALFVSNELRVRNILTGLTRSSVNTRNVQLLVPDDWLNFQVMEVGYYQKFNIHILAPSHFLEFPLDGTSWPERYKAFFHAWPDAYAEMGYLLASHVFMKSFFLEDRNWVEAIKSTDGDRPNLRFDFSSNSISGAAGLNRRVRIIGFEQGQAIYKTGRD